MQISRFRFAKGYTLAEVMAVLLIILILLSIGVPAMGKLIRRYQISTIVSDFYASLQLARSEAIRRGARIDLVPAGDGRDWKQGWIVMQDKNGNRVADESDDIIFTHGPAPRAMMIRDGFNDPAQLYFAYNGSGYGRSHASSQAARAGSWTFSLEDESRKLIVNFTGRPRLCNPREEPPDCGCRMQKGMLSSFGFIACCWQQASTRPARMPVWPGRACLLMESRQTDADNRRSAIRSSPCWCKKRTRHLNRQLPARY